MLPFNFCLTLARSRPGRHLRILERSIFYLACAFKSLINQEPKYINSVLSSLNCEFTFSINHWLLSKHFTPTMYHLEPSFPRKMPFISSPNNKTSQVTRSSKTEKAQSTISTSSEKCTKEINTKSTLKKEGARSLLKVQEILIHLGM